MDHSSQTRHLRSRKAFVLYILVLAVLIVGLMSRYLVSRNILEFLRFP